MTVVCLKIAWIEGVVHTRRMTVGMCTGRNIIYCVRCLLQNNKEKKTEIVLKNSCAVYFVILQYISYIILYIFLRVHIRI